MSKFNVYKPFYAKWHSMQIGWNFISYKMTINEKLHFFIYNTSSYHMRTRSSILQFAVEIMKTMINGFETFTNK